LKGLESDINKWMEEKLKKILSSTNSNKKRGFI